jgi:tetratricopeptide (TPR) repeat protein
MGDKPATRSENQSVARVLLQADKFLREGQPQQSVLMLSRAVQKWPLSIKPRLALALSFERLNQSDKAMDVYRKIVSLQPDNVSAIASLGYLMVENNLSVSAANKLLGRALDISPSCGRALDGLGLSALRQKKNDAAEKYFARARISSPDDPSPLYHSGLIALRLRQTAKALTSFQQVVELDRSHDKAYISLGILYLQMGEREKSVGALNRAYVIAGDNRALIGSIEELLKKASPHWQPSDAAKIKFEVSWPGLRKDFFDVEDFRFDLPPSDDVPAQLKGQSELTMTSTDSKAGFKGRSAENATDLEEPVSLVSSEKTEGIVSLFPDKNARKDSPKGGNNTPMTIDQAVAASEGIVRQNMVSRHMRLGRLYYEYDLMREAASEFQTVINISPLSVEAREARELVVPLSDFEEPSKEDRIAGFMEVAGTLFKHSDKAGTILQYQKVLLIDPGNALAHKNLAYVYLKDGLMSEAYRHVNESLASDPEQADSLIIKGFILAKRRNFIEAKDAFSKASEIIPSDSETGRYARNMAEKMSLFTELR